MFLSLQVEDNGLYRLRLCSLPAPSSGVDPAVTGMAIAWGDAWTNLIQPFWAIPALAIAKLNAKDIMGFCLIDLLVTGVIICLGFLLWV